MNGITYKARNAKETKFPAGNFDVVISKGVLDAVECGDEVHDDYDYTHDLVEVGIEMMRVLKIRGVWAMFTMCSTSKRLGFLEDMDYFGACSVHKFAKIAEFPIPSNIDPNHTC